MEVSPGHAAFPEVDATARKSTLSGAVPPLSSVCVFIILLPLALAPVIRAGEILIQLNVTPCDKDEIVTGSEAVLEQMV